MKRWSHRHLPIGSIPVRCAHAASLVGLFVPNVVIRGRSPSTATMPNSAPRSDGRSRPWGQKCQNGSLKTLRTVGFIRSVAGVAGLVFLLVMTAFIDVGDN